MPDLDDDMKWTLASSAAAIGAATLAKNALTSRWTKRRGKVPGNPATEDNSWGEAMVWAMLSGMVVGVVRLFAQRGVAEVFTRRSGSIPDKARTQATA